MINVEFEKKWIATFATNLTAQERERVGIGTDKGYLWHAFSYGLVPALVGDEARNAFNVIEKDGASEFFYDFRCAPLRCSKKLEKLSLKHFTAEGIDTDENAVELYIIGKNWEWCYIVTHEESLGLGPYFCCADPKEK